MLNINIKNQITLFVISLFVILLVACGRSDTTAKSGSTNEGNQNGDTQPTSLINSINADQVSVASLGVITDNLSKDQALDVYSGAFGSSGTGAFGGSYDFSGIPQCDNTNPGTLEVITSEGSVVLAFTDYCIKSWSESQITINGTVTINFVNQVKSIKTSNLSLLVLDKGEYLINIDIVIDPNADPVITYNQFSYTDPDGVVHDITGFQSMSGNFRDGVDITDGSFHYPDVGNVTVTTLQTLEFNCGNNHPSAGKIEIVAEDDSGVIITIIDCNTYSVEHNGVVTEKTWPTW